MTSRLSLRMFGRRIDKLHIFLLFLCGLLSILFIQHSTYKDDLLSKTYMYESPSYVVPSIWTGANNKSLVQYDRNVPLLWIGGVPRSGTTLMRSMLDAHPLIRCGEETRIVPRMLSMHGKMFKDMKEMNRLSEAHITRQLLDSAQASYILTVIAGHGEPAPLLCNKDPFAIRFTVNILHMFPKSKFILMIRDARSVAHSIISRHITIKGFDTKTYRGSLGNWNQAVKTMLTACKDAGVNRCLPVYYERLVLEPKSQMKRILSFLEIPWNDIVLHHEQTIGKAGGISLSKKEPSTDQVNKAVNLEALSKWYGTFPNATLKEIEKVAPLLPLLGYATNKYPPDYNKDLDPILEHTLNVL